MCACPCDVSRSGSSLYLQFAGDDQFVLAPTRPAYAAADPAAARVSLYPATDHSFDSPDPAARHDRLAVLEARLAL